MIVFNYEHTIHFDLDDTLIFWGDNYDQPFEGAVQITDPYDGEVTYHKVHNRHIRFLKKQVAKGLGVVVWSARGVKCAEAAIKALGLDDLNIMVMSKPGKVVDDLSDARDILPKVIYLHEDKFSP